MRLAGFGSGACPALLDAVTADPTTRMFRNCAKNRNVLRAAIGRRDLKFDYAVLYSHWTLYGARQDKYFLVGPGADHPARNQDRVFTDALRATLDLLKASGVERILIIGPTPTFPKHASVCVQRARHYGIDPDSTCAVARRTVDQAVTTAWRRLKAAVRAEPSVRLIDPRPAFCDREVCRATLGDVALFSDTNHITDAGMNAIISVYRNSFDWVFGAGAERSEGPLPIAP